MATGRQRRAGRDGPAAAGRIESHAARGRQVVNGRLYAIGGNDGR
jgi:hypothetical protein